MPAAMSFRYMAVCRRASAQANVNCSVSHRRPFPRDRLWTSQYRWISRRWAVGMHRSAKSRSKQEKSASRRPRSGAIPMLRQWRSNYEYSTTDRVDGNGE